MKQACEYEKSLTQDLIENYNRLVRPVKKNSDKLVVKFGVKLIQLLDVVIINLEKVCFLNLIIIFYRMKKIKF